ncbi:uncharacterized protein LOC136094972 [Hydra vulgaris]|uniref:uncharacterized protein LOC136094972 n=2 Tax=Hydra vulgaris TaxID=6087 RepID=UPI0032EA16BA
MNTSKSKSNKGSRMSTRDSYTEEDIRKAIEEVKSAQKRAHPVTKETIMSLVTSLLSDERLLMEVNRDRPFQFGRSGTRQPGNKWYKLFLSRHPNIVARMTESLSANRRNVSQAVIQQWFADIRSYLSEHDLLEILQEPQRNYNIDESGFQFSSKVSKVLAAKGSKNVPYATSSKEKERITDLANVGADGSLPTPLIIYPNLRIPMNVYEAIPSSLFAIGKSESGYINHQVLYEYLTNAFDQWLTQHNIQRPVIVWSDKHESRLQFHLVKTLADLQIMLILIPPNCTHFMQPLDVGLFGPMKNEWAKCVNRFRAANPNEYVTKESFAGMFLPVYTRVMSREKIVKSFKKCGIQPFDQDAPDYTKLTLEEAHSGDSRIFEGVLQDGRVEASTQVENFFHVNVATQTSSDIILSGNTSTSTMEGLGAGPNIHLITKSFDDFVIDSPRFDSLRMVKRQNWFQYVFDRNHRQEDAPAVDSLVVSPVHSPSIHSSSDAQCSSISAPPNRTRPMLVEPQRQARPPAISPALKNHKWFPSPKKVIGKVRTVAQELYATSVVTSDKVVSMLEVYVLQIAYCNDLIYKVSIVTKCKKCQKHWVCLSPKVQNFMLNNRYTENALHIQESTVTSII